MTLAQAVWEFQGRFDRVSDEIGFPANEDSEKRDWSKAPTGERYIAVTNGGIKPEGSDFPAHHHDMTAAIAAWLVEANKYADNKGAILYWRERPQVEIDWLRRGWVVYSRLAIG
jgi:hypothetical protein